MKTCAGVAIAVVVSFGLMLTPPAFARGGGHGGGAFGMSGPSFSSAGLPRGFSSSGGRRIGWNGASTPPGWSHGRKTGWHGGTMPPGLARHMNARMSSRTSSRARSR